MQSVNEIMTCINDNRSILFFDIKRELSKVICVLVSTTV